mmetsp:Transcript_15045/g.49909  ORF Transcript_15045/g.49909 Transcript_15045/m.49909 type:complete len:118 (+) Transcript_15045:1201-1554(+)
MRSSDAMAGVRLLAVASPRGEAWGGVEEGANVGKRRAAAKRGFIEARNAAGLVNRTANFAALSADLRLLSASHSFVGTAASWTSRLALLAITGERGALPPFVMLDRPLGQLWFAGKS